MMPLDAPFATSELMRELNAACNLRELRLGEVHVPVTSASGLLTKLEYASVKLAEGKNADAIQKLTNFRDTVTALNAQGKINPDDANSLISGANDAIACIGTPETQTPIAA